MSELFSVHKRLIGLGLMGALVLALAVLGGLWGLSHTATAQDDLGLVHVEPDGSDFTGNPYCPSGGPAWDDCNNVTSQDHVIRTDGYVDVGDDDGDGVFDEDPPGDADGDTDPNDDGDTQCDGALDNDADTIVNDGCPAVDAPEDAATECADAVDDDDDGSVNDGCPPYDPAASEDGCGADTCSNTEDDGATCDDSGIDGADYADTDCQQAGAETGEQIDEDAGLFTGAGTWNIQNSGANAIIVAQGRCGDLSLVTDRTLWQDDDGDTVADEDTGGIEDDNDGDTLIDEDDPNNEDDDGDQLENGGRDTPGVWNGECTDDADNDGDATCDTDGCTLYPDTPDDDCIDPDNPGVDEDPEDDDGDGEVDEDPVGTPKDDEFCVVIHSTLPGETVISLTYDSSLTDTVVKEWDSIVDTVILKDGDFSGARPIDADGDTDVYDADDEHLLNRDGETQDHPVVFDEAEKRIRSLPPVRLVEIVHGEHEVVLDSVQETEVLHHPTQGAIIKVTIDSPGCTYFTDATAAYHFGTAMNGVSDGEGRFVGPKVAPANAQPSSLVIPGVDNDGDGDVDEDPVDGVDNDGDTLTDEDDRDSHNGESASQTDYDLRDIYLDTACEEQATIHIQVGYPGPVGSLKLAPEEEITINWTTIEISKQPQIRWAGEQIVLAKRWALPDGLWFPNQDEDCGADPDKEQYCPVCPHVGNLVQYNREDPSPGGLEEGVPNIGGPLASYPDRVVTIIDEECISRAVYESEEPGQVDVKALMWETLGGMPLDNETANSFPLFSRQMLINELNACIADFYVKDGLPDSDGDEDTKEDPEDLEFCIENAKAAYISSLGAAPVAESIINKHAFLVWYIKIYQVKLENIPLSDDTGREDHNAGTWDGEDPLTDEALDAETLNVSQDALLRVQVKGWFFGGNSSSRGAVCVDKDGDGDEAGSEPGVPYPLGQYEEGCADPDDEILDHGHWVLPDDMAALAGPHPDRLATWDVMSEVDVSPATDLIGPKSSLDSHDAIARPWVPCLESEDGSPVACDPARKSIEPDGKITEADAIMPPLKIRAAMSDPVDGVDNDGDEEVDEDAGFLKVAMKSADVGIDSAYQSIFIPADPEIPAIVNNGGYDWMSWGPVAYMYNYPFYHELTKTTQDGLIIDFHFYTDNRGHGFFFANGDYNLSFDDCVIQELFGAPDCETGDVVGISEITVIGDYPYFRKHAAIESNPVTKTWTWGGFKEVTAERVDATHIAIVAHVKDRDGYCKYEAPDLGTVDPGEDIDVIFSPSLNPVQHEEIEFILNTEVGSVVAISSNATFAVPHTPLGEATVMGAEDGVLIDRSEAVALAEDVRVLEGMEALDMVDVGARDLDHSDVDECQAWILIQHPVDEDPDVSVYFHDPEGTVTRHWPPTVLLVNLVTGWNDSCYVGPEAAVEDAAEDLLDDENENGVTDLLAIYRFDNEAQEFDRWFPDAAEGVNTIESLGASDQYDQLFVLMEVGIDWLQEITPAPDSADLVEGWSSICYAGPSKGVEDATSNIIGDFEILYTLGSDQLWRRFVPGEAWLTNIVSLNQYTSVFLLVTTEGGANWVFNP